MKKFMIVMILFIIAITFAYLFENNHDYIKVGKLYINEIVASNSYVLMDDDKEFSDYIELYNDYNYDINLERFYITDRDTDIKKWTFPNITINKKSYLIIFASGKDKYENGIVHTNFKLNKDGESISLIDKTGNIISKVRYPKLPSDLSYSYSNGKYIVTEATPNKENKKEVSSFKKENYKIIINEYMSHNDGITYTEDGIYSDWIELYNYGDIDVNLKGISLTDNPENLNKYIFPDVTIKAKDYLVIYLNDEKNNSKLYANFKLSDEDKKIILSSNDIIIDEVDVIALPKNVSYGRVSDKWYYFYSPTLGSENNTKKWEVIRQNGNS